MLPVQGFPGHHHVAPGAPGVREVSLLQYDHGVPDMGCSKCTLIALCVATRTQHASARELIGEPVVVKATLYVCGSLTGAVVSHFSLPPDDFPC